MLQLARPRPSALNISSQTPRATTSYIAPLTSLSTTSSSYPASPPPAFFLPQSLWSPDTPSPLSLHTIRSPGPPRTPVSPINPFLVAPRSMKLFDPHALFPMAAPLLQASPLSMFEGAVSPTSRGVGARTPTSISLATKDALVSPVSPLSPRFLNPRTPPSVPHFRAQRRASAWDAMQRKLSVASMRTLGKENLGVGMGMYRLFALREWKRVTRETKEKSWLGVKWARLLRRSEARKKTLEQTKSVML